MLAAQICFDNAGMPEHLCRHSFGNHRTLLQRDCPVGNAREEIDLMIDDAQGRTGITQIP
jgi:hypothetical protein